MSDDHMAKMRAARKPDWAERATATRAAAAPKHSRNDDPDPGTPVEQEQERAKLEAEVRKAREMAARLADTADKMERRLPLPAPVTIVTGAPPARGVPRKFTLERQRQYLDAVSRGTGVNAAAKLAGVTRQTIKNYRDSDPDFAVAEKEAYRSLADDAEVALYQLAMTGNIEAIKTLLYNIKPDMWTPPQKMVLEVTGQVEHIHDLPSALADIQKLEAALRARVLRQDETPALGAGAVDAEVVED